MKRWSCTTAAQNSKDGSASEQDCGRTTRRAEALADPGKGALFAYTYGIGSIQIRWCCPRFIAELVDEDRRRIHRGPRLPAL